MKRSCSSISSDSTQIQRCTPLLCKQEEVRKLLAHVLSIGGVADIIFACLSSDAKPRYLYANLFPDLFYPALLDHIYSPALGDLSFCGPKDPECIRVSVEQLEHCAAYRNIADHVRPFAAQVRKLTIFRKTLPLDKPFFSFVDDATDFISLFPNVEVLELENCDGIEGGYIRKGAETPLPRLREIVLKDTSLQKSARNFFQNLFYAAPHLKLTICFHGVMEEEPLYDFTDSDIFMNSCCGHVLTYCVSNAPQFHSLFSDGITFEGSLTYKSTKRTRVFSPVKFIAFPYDNSSPRIYSLPVFYPFNSYWK